MAEQHIEGLEGILTSLKQLPKELVGKNGGPIRKGLRAGAYLIRDAAIQKAPFRAQKQKGREDQPHLRDNIVAELDRAPQKMGVNERFRVGVRGGARLPYANTVRNRRARRVGKTYQLSSTTYYWRFLEFGTETMGKKPFLRPAFDENAGKALTMITQETQVAIHKIAKRLASRRAAKAEMRKYYRGPAA